MAQDVADETARARRIESPPENAGGFAGGSKGTVRVSPELLDYFRRLDAGELPTHARIGDPGCGFAVVPRCLKI